MGHAVSESPSDRLCRHPTQINNCIGRFNGNFNLAILSTNTKIEFSSLQCFVNFPYGVSFFFKKAYPVSIKAGNFFLLPKPM